MLTTQSHKTPLIVLAGHGGLKKKQLRLQAKQQLPLPTFNFYLQIFPGPNKNIHDQWLSFELIYE